jgi:uncharacterized membrane protein YbhN (UPF0104 family)
VHSGQQTLLHRVGAAAARAGGGTAKRPRLRQAIRVTLTLIVVAFLVTAVATRWDEVREEDIAFDAIWLAAALASLTLLYVLAAFGWDLTLRALGHHLPARRAQAVWAQSLLARYVPGAVLMVVGRVLLAEQEGVPRRTTLASMVYEQGLMGLSAAMIGLGVLIADARLGPTVLVLTLAATALCLAAMHPRIFGPLADAVLRLFGRDPLQTLLPLGTVLLLLGFYLGVWVVFGVGTLLAAQTAFELSLSDLPAVTAAQALGYSAALVTVIFPGGLGIRDGTFALLLDRAMPGGFALAAAIAIVVRLVTTAAEVIYAAGALILGRRGKSSNAHPLREAT